MEGLRRDWTDPVRYYVFPLSFHLQERITEVYSASGDKNKEALTLLEESYDLDDPEAYKALLMEEKQLVKHDDVDAGDSTPNTKRKKETEAVSWSKVMCDPYYRTCTWTICLLALLNQVTGINSINIYSQTIFESI